jgi:hypothetical protein
MRNERRIGIIEVQRRMMIEEWELVLKAFKSVGFLPIYLEQNPFYDSIKYTGFCSKFKIIDEGCIAPVYRLVAQQHLNENGKIKKLTFSIDGGE